ncbi:MAG TPA: septal ring lytic transglycosylase RlpA family protein [Rudaea sp.]
MTRQRQYRSALPAAALALAALGGCAHRPARAPGTEPVGAAPVPSTPRAGAGRYAQDRDSTPDGPPPDLSKITEPVPKAEPLSQYGNKSPYTVLGETYRVLPSAKGYVERGIASWYGNKFHGYTTSTFEKYDMYAYSAAHKTLPLPSYARVTNIENGHSVIVRVNDRGPFVANRVIDLSYVAAVKLGVWPKGTAMVEVKAIDPAHPDQEPAPPAAVSARTSTGAAPAKTPKPALYLQVGAYADRANAERAAAAMRAAHLGDVRVVSAQIGGKTVQRVRLGPLADVGEADRLTPKVRSLGLGEPRVAIDN